MEQDKARPQVDVAGIALARWERSFQGRLSSAMRVNARARREARARRAAARHAAAQR